MTEEKVLCPVAHLKEECTERCSWFNPHIKTCVFNGLNHNLFNLTGAIVNKKKNKE